jgi:hypothetical protein
MFKENRCRFIGALLQPEEFCVSRDETAQKCQDEDGLPHYFSLRACRPDFGFDPVGKRKERNHGQPIPCCSERVEHIFKTMTLIHMWIVVAEVVFQILSNC